ncbi:ubiquinol-cytochrome c reductase iron-sulfur subunit [Deinococcus radiophilus]|uniref:ubiquinol-cytochrome c reductase iron-sulfur subunit n=1 Tax=Deinococcus radiophilus TaxID=32062 RepID=UPI00360BCF48
MTRYKIKDPELTRRRFINMAMGATATVGTVSLLGTLGGAHPVFRLTEDKKPPMEGDILVHADPAKEGTPITMAELSETQVTAWPMGTDADGNQIIRKGEPNNLLALYRTLPALSGEAVIEATIDGEVVAYSDICTHAGCPVPDAKDGTGMFCPCHSGQYSPTEGGIVAGGPPPHKLAQLPIVAEGDSIKVSGFFLTHPYPYTDDATWEATKQAAEEA